MNKLAEIEKKLEQLREEYKKANEKDRKLINIRAKLLIRSKERIQAKEGFI